MKARYWYLLILSLSVVIGGCHRRGLTLVFVVPDGYAGILKLQQSPTGVVLHPTNGVVELYFSTNGICEVKGDLPTR